MALVTCGKCGKQYDNDVKFFENTSEIGCPFCGSKSIADSYMKKSSIGFNPFIIIIAVFALVGLFSIIWAVSSSDRIDHNNHHDGKCDICGKTATYSSSSEEYCDKHLRDAVKWYME